MFEHILFAHNDIQARDTFYETLTNSGYKVTTVTDHKEILDVLKKERPDCIILDPELNDLPAKAASERIKLVDEEIKVIIPPQGSGITEIIKTALQQLRVQTAAILHEPASKVQIKANILVVDDEKECIELIKSYLSRRGYNVETASSGEEASLKLKANTPHIVFLDIYMQGMDGLIILKKIKDFYKNTTVIMTTALEDEKTVQKAFELGADGYLIKPFKLQDLEAAVLNEALDNLK